MANKKWWNLIDWENIKTIDDIGFIGDPDMTPAQRKADAKRTSEIYEEYRRTGKLPNLPVPKPKVKKAKKR